MYLKSCVLAFVLATFFNNVYVLGSSKSKSYDVAISKPGECPPSNPQMHCYVQQDLCKNDCDCPASEKCCFQQDCGLSCMPANKTGVEPTCEKPIASSTKYGTCPGPDLKICAQCFDQCLSDCECEGTKMCCPQPGCGNECKEPVSSGWAGKQ